MNFSGEKDVMRQVDRYVIEIDEYELQRLIPTARLQALQMQAQGADSIAAKILALAAIAREIEKGHEDERKKREESSARSIDHTPGSGPILG